MYINRDVVWTSCTVELPKNTRPVTAVIESLEGKHTVGAFYKDEKWYEQYTKQEITNKVICYTDIEIPEAHLF